MSSAADNVASFMRFNASPFRRGAQRVRERGGEGIPASPRQPPPKSGAFWCKTVHPPLPLRFAKRQRPRPPSAPPRCAASAATAHRRHAKPSPRPRQAHIPAPIVRIPRCALDAPAPDSPVHGTARVLSAACARSAMPLPTGKRVRPPGDAPTAGPHVQGIAAPPPRRIGAIG